ncbi:hypothetical protein ACEWY4_019634 [Coilia grayii]|uniref:Uncharacterized protein n=1 Tax=Coilia grayii TaxID=363190 RepID=A0ABD1JA92_9TELE
MRCSVFSICVMMTGSVCLAIFIHKKKIEEAELAKGANFEDIKNTVTNDFLSEVTENLSRDQGNLEAMKKQIEELKTTLQTQQNTAAAAKRDADECQGDAKKTSDELANLEVEQNNLKSEKEAWTKDVASLKQQVTQRSKVCDYILKDSKEGKKLCGQEVPQEVPKQEEPKQEAPKAGPPAGEGDKPPAEPPKTR